LRVVPLGDLAAYVEFSRTLDLEVNELVQRLAVAVYALRLPWIREIVPGLGGLALHFDPAFDKDIVQTAADVVAQCIKGGLPDADDLGREVEVPVCYDDEFAPDIEEVAKKINLSKVDVQKRHAAAEYRVLMIGFAPGHAYMGGLDPKLSVPRRASPRASVPAGAVAIANLQTVVYPYAISGGWSVIGRTPLAVFDAGRSRPSLFGPGDRVRFRSIKRNEFLEMMEKQ
jgi:KipI family sensor histidine kinase inhibitor